MLQIDELINKHENSIEYLHRLKIKERNYFLKQPDNESFNNESNLKNKLEDIDNKISEHYQQISVLRIRKLMDIC